MRYPVMLRDEKTLPEQLWRFVDILLNCLCISVEFWANHSIEQHRSWAGRLHGSVPQELWESAP